MSNDVRCNVNDLFDLFEEVLSASDVLSAKLMSQISAAITKERIRSHMNQKEFADLLDVSQSEISRWEHGDYNFSLKKIAQIAEKLDMDVDISFTRLSDKKSYGEYAFLSAPSTFTVVYNSDEQKQYKNTCVHKIRMEAFQHASICK